MRAGEEARSRRSTSGCRCTRSRTPPRDAVGGSRCGSTRRSRPTSYGLLVYFHGGAFFLGSLDTHDHVARSLAKETGLKVVSVGYRLAPEARLPGRSRGLLRRGPLGRRERRQPGLGRRRPSRSPATAPAAPSSPRSPRWRTTTASTRITHQVLYYPSLDLDFDVDRYASLRENADGYGLETAGLKPFNAFYLDSGADPADPLRLPDQARGPHRPAAGSDRHRRARPAARRGRALRPAAAGGRRATRRSAATPAPVTDSSSTSPGSRSTTGRSRRPPTS